jgi:hypothetical protein
MATYKDLQDRINLDYLNRTTLIPETKRAIRAAIRTYEATRFWFNETVATAVASTSIPSIAVPTDFLLLDRLEVVLPSGACALRQQDFGYLRYMQINSPVGQPANFAYRGNRFEFDVTPNSAYPVIVYYIRSLPDLSADADTNEWTNEAANLVAHCATLNMLGSTLNTADDRKVAYHRTQMALARNELELRNTQRLSYKLKPTLF